MEGPKPRRVDGIFTWTGKTNLQIYEKEFEARFLKDSKESATKYATQWMNELNCPEYCSAVTKYIDNEETNADIWIDFASTKPALIKAVVKAMITNVARDLVTEESGARRMFEQKNKEELKLLYGVLSRDSETLDTIIEIMQPFIKG